MDTLMRENKHSESKNVGNDSEAAKGWRNKDPRVKSGHKWH